MTKTLILAAVAALALAAPVAAADLRPVTAPTTIEAIIADTTWTGPYVGLNGVVEVTNGATQYGPELVVGYNQAIDMFLVGAEVSLEGLNYVNGVTFNEVTVGVTGKAGVILTDTVGVYALAGLERELNTGVNSGRVGAGVEAKLTQEVSIVGEYARSWEFGNTVPSDQFTVGLRYSF